ncbi:DUF2218 domain-containing protein [Uliginosibacterium sediminicola]|uniref:DUF2218 domain-containing protein n=1 Tax=Uliginosibacterium sediminicola TaxID=2024550 RepID=A0ABU9Z2Q4_9RHOO
MIQLQTRFAAAEPGKMILKLCKHFRHKVPAVFDASRGEVDFQPGRCVLSAEADAVHVFIEGADEAEIGRLKYVLDDHVRRFLRAETLELDWQSAAPPIC